MPTQYSQSAYPVRRLLWWLIAGLLLLGVLSVAASFLVQRKAEQWLAERGLEVQIDYLQVSIPRLRLLVRGVEMRNAEGRGMRARELVLDYSWWQLLRGRLQLQRAALDGAYMDLESSAGERGRRWEIGGWALGQGERRDRDLRLMFEQVRLRDSRLCYRHRPQWPTPSCVSFGNLQARDFLLAMQREGDVPLDLSIGAERLRINDLLVQEQGSAQIDTVLAKLDLSEGLYRRPGNKITADELSASMFGSCPPQRWAEVLQGLRRLIGHCGTARRLQLEGELQFSFGRGSEVHWHRASGEGVKLRHRHRRWQNWAAGTLALDDFSYIREERRLSWQRGGARAFDWCPPGLRSGTQHYCIRAGTMRLPHPVTFDWSKNLQVSAGAGRLQQAQLLDIAGKNRDPLTAQRIELGDLTYRGDTRTLQVDGLDLASGNGCIPGQLWQQPDYCVRVAGLHSAEPLQLRFRSAKAQTPWGFASGPLRLAQLRVQRQKSLQLQLQDLRWQRMNFLGGEAPLLVQDFGLQRLSGCLPEALLSERLRPLCADVNRLDGRGTFAWRGGSDGYLILGQLDLQRLLLADRRDSNRGLLLQKLHTGEGFFRRSADGDNPWIDDDAAALTPAAPSVAQKKSDSAADSPGAEKGLLPPELAQRAQAEAASEKTALPDAANPNLKLDELSLSKLQGCLPASWLRLLYENPAGMPGCFDVLNLRQRSPLHIAWSGGIDLATHQLAIERANARTSLGQTLLQLEELHLPSARVRYLAGGRDIFVALPFFSLQEFYGCLPQQMQSLALDIACADIQGLRLGRDFKLRADSRQISADLSDVLVEQILLTRRDEQFVAELRELLAPQLQFLWPRVGGPRGAKRQASMQVKNFSAATARACLPERVPLRAGLPRCVETEDLRTTGSAEATGLALGETLFKMAPVAEPLWRIESIVAPRIALTSDALELHGLRLRQVLTCGLRSLLPLNLRELGVADCITAADLNFTGVSRLGLTASVARLQLGGLESEPIALWQESGDYSQLGLQRLSWESLRWNGGPLVWLTDLEITGFRGCLAGPVRQVAEDIAAALDAPLGGGCIRLGELYLPGTQAISLAAPFSIGGSVQLTGLAIGRESGEPWEIASLQLDQFAYGGGDASIGSLSGLSGCLPPGALGETRLAPCYRLGPVRVGAIERIDTAAGRITELRGFSIDGVQLAQPDHALEPRAPPELPAQLLQLESLFAERLRFGAGEVVAQQLALEGIAGCVPRGYIERVDHCLVLQSLSASGSYRAGDEGLALAQLRLGGIQLLSGDGRQLVRGESIAVEQLLSNRAQFRFLRAEAADFALFDRPESAPEYDRHSVVGRLAGMEVGQFEYDKIGRRLEIANVDALRPRLIVARNRAGDYPFLQEFAVLTGAGRTEKPLTRAADAVTSELKFRYLIHELDVRHGTFTWVDRRGRYRARLPIRAIYLTMLNISNRPGHPPAVVLLNGRPGGFGEIQLAGTIDYLDTRKWNADLTGYIENTNLIPATPYMAELLGYKILQGQLDARLDIQIRENKVEAFADMELNKIKVRRVRESDQLPVKSSLIPLDIALALLKDGQGNVRFGMPVSGDLYDPKFSFSFIFSHLLQQAILESLLAYFTPIGLYTLGKFAWGRFRAVRFDPITFEPGSAELSDEAREQLQEMLVTLRERPDARPGICGIANARDWNALYPNATPGLGGSRKARETFYRHPPLMLFEEFEHLALERSRKIESYLLDAGISARELIPCAPDYNGRDFDEPRVEFSN